MRTVKFFGMIIFVCIGMFCNAQQADVTVVVKGIKEAKGNIMVAAGNKSEPQTMIYDMVEVTTMNGVTCLLKNVPVGTCNLYIYQDLNDNYCLDLDENNLPLEPCYTKEKVRVKEGGMTIEVKLISVKELMGN